MTKLKKLLQEFKAFITRGNVVDMAVAVIIGAAFSAIVTALTNGIIMPLVNWACGGKDGVTGLYTVLQAVYTTDADNNMILDMTNSIYIDWSTFINKVIDFILIALVLFIIIKVFMGLQNARKDIDAKAKARAEKLAAKYKKQGMSEEEAKAKAEAETAPEAPAEPAKPTTDELLTEIRDLLAAQNNADKK
jgi:large conductance mechanosensitive channel